MLMKLERDLARSDIEDLMADCCEAKADHDAGERRDLFVKVPARTLHEVCELALEADTAKDGTAIARKLLHRAVELLSEVEYTATYAEKADAFCDEAKSLLGLAAVKKRRRA